MGDSPTKEDLRLLLQEGQVAKEARAELSSQYKELLYGFNRGMQTAADGTASCTPRAQNSSRIHAGNQQQSSAPQPGLADSIRLDVELHVPPDLAHTMNLARAFKSKLCVLKEA
ncbi:conserved hypothetical protein [Ricinus communis]|uniref:Uncharacterized protein n=1 Tax=Ricinus communis TaxID=3988 RepID=B9SNU4_RICCO|nr:conserved hypothetical protein [Ricinus communis]